MKLREIIAENNITKVDTIYYRCNYPKSLYDELSEEEKIDGMLAGIAHFRDGVLTSGDGDNYSLNDELERYELDIENDYLTVWYHAVWSSDEN